MPSSEDISEYSWRYLTGNSTYVGHSNWSPMDELQFEGGMVLIIRQCMLCQRMPALMEAFLFMDARISNYGLSLHLSWSSCKAV